MTRLRTLWLLVIAFILLAGAFAQFDLVAMSFASFVVAVFVMFSIAAAGTFGYLD